MNKLIACALLGLGLTQVLAGCSSDDSNAVDGTGGSGGKGGASAGGSGGKAAGGASTQGGSSSGGKVGTGGGGTGATGGTGAAGKGGSGGTGIAVGGAPAEGGVGGADTSTAGAGGTPDVPPPDPQPVTATKSWLAQFCLSRVTETKNCDHSIDFDSCYGEYEGFFGGTALCTNDDDVLSKYVALQGALDALATACPMPDTSEVRCNVAGDPEFIKQACRDADAARLTATMNCALPPP